MLTLICTMAVVIASQQENANGRRRIRASFETELHSAYDVSLSSREAANGHSSSREIRISWLGYGSNPLEGQTQELGTGYSSDEISPESSQALSANETTSNEGISSSGILGRPEVNESPLDSDVEEFRQGYRDGGGPLELEDHFIFRVLPCEAGTKANGSIDWTPGNSDYRSAAQFHPASWATIERQAGRSLRFESPYDVGLAVAIWVQLIGKANIATTGGWPICGR